MKYFILYNCKNKENDKKWLHETFEAYGLEICVIEPKVTIHKLLFMSGIKGKIKWTWSILDQAFRTIWKSKTNDIIIVWYPIGGGYH